MIDSFADTPPFYVRATYFLLFLALVLAGLYWAQSIIIPLIAAMLFAFLLLPVVFKLEKWNIPSWIAALIGVFMVIATVLTVCIFLCWQMMSFGSDLPMMQSALEQKGASISTYVEQNFDISRQTQSQWWEKNTDKFIDQSASSAMNIFSATGAAVAKMLLIPIIMFFLLLYRTKFKKFIVFVSPNNQENVLAIIRKISGVSQRYLQGMVIVILILTVLNSIGFLFLGLKYAVLLAFIAAVLNIIPYVGVLIGSLIPVAIALVTKDSPMYALGALGVCMFVQFLENNFITPKIVGSSVNLNPLSALISLLLSGLLWGLPGMIFAIPLAGIFKVICDNVEQLRLYGFLLGEEVTVHSWKLKYPRPVSLPKKAKAS